MSASPGLLHLLPKRADLTPPPTRVQRRPLRPGLRLLAPRGDHDKALTAAPRRTGAAEGPLRAPALQASLCGRPRPIPAAHGQWLSAGAEGGRCLARGSPRFAEPDPGCRPSRTSSPCLLHSLPPSLLQAWSLIWSLRRSPPPGSALLRGPCAGYCLSFWTHCPFFPALRPGRLTLGNQGLLYPQASRWAQPVGAVAEGGGAAGRVYLGSRQGGCAVPAPVLQPFFFLISFFNWGLITILWPCLERPLQAPVTCSSANSSRPGGGESSPLPTLGMWNRPLLISSNCPAPL